MNGFRSGAKQDWIVGSVVKIGFVAGLKVLEKIATPGDYRPDGYVLQQESTGRVYSFQPHYGLARHASIIEARTAF